MSDFKITDMSTAEWAMRKIKESENEIEKLEAHAKSEKERIDNWLKEASETHKNTIEHFTNHLRFYLETENKKSIKLINGTLSKRKRQPKWELEDKETLVKQLENKGLQELIRIKKEPDLSEIKKAFDVVEGKAINTETGEIIEGINVIEQEDSFSVRVEQEVKT